MRISFRRTVTLLFAVLLVLSFCSCTAFDEDYGTQSKPETVSDIKENVKIPEIKSDDEVMPTYFDISLYDEENYADIYLGKKFKYNFTYCGSELELPSTYKEMIKKGFTPIQDSEFLADSTVLAGKSARMTFINAYNKKIDAVFYNSGKSSQSLKKCPLVKVIIPENIVNYSESEYGQFWINGVSNESAITDIAEYLGSPSHFYAVSENEYYLDYFLTEKDKRSGITVYVNPLDDVVNSIEISYY